MSQTINLFKGRFAVVGFDSMDGAGNWVERQRTPQDGTHDWEFFETSVRTLPSGTVIYEGI